MIDDLPHIHLVYPYVGARVEGDDSHMRLCLGR